MSRLSALKPALKSLPSTIAFAPQDERERDRFRNRQHWRAWYKTARWRALRKHVLMRDRYRCRMCGQLEGDTSQLVADHVQPHRGDPALFWDVGNIACTCKPCHDGAKQSQERRA